MHSDPNFNSWADVGVILHAHCTPQTRNYRTSLADRLFRKNDTIISFAEVP